MRTFVIFCALSPVLRLKVVFWEHFYDPSRRQTSKRTQEMEKVSISNAFQFLTVNAGLGAYEITDRRFGKPPFTFVFRCTREDAENY